MADNDADKRQSSRVSKLAKGVGKAYLYTTPAGLTYYAIKKARGKQVDSTAKTTAPNPTLPNPPPPQSNVQSTQPQTPSPPVQPGKTAQVAKSALKGAGKVYMYTSPGAFIVGKLWGRKKQRDAARKQIEQLKNSTNAGNSPGDNGRSADKPKRPNFFTKSAKTIGKAYLMATPAYWLHKLAAKRFPKATQKFDSFFKSKKKPSEGKQHKSVFDYVEEWNKATLQKTEARRRFIKDNLKRFFKSRVWKYGKYVVSPGGAVAYSLGKKYIQQKRSKEAADAYLNYYKNPPASEENKSSHGSSTTPPRPPSRITGFAKSTGKAIYKYTTPAGQIQTAWGKWGQPRMSNWNNRLGRRFGNPPSPRQLGGRAAKKIGSQLGKTVLKQAVLAFFKTPPGWVTLGVIAAIFLFFGLMMLITSVLTGGGGGGGSSVGGGTPVGGVPGSNDNPIPGFTLSKSVSDATIPEPSEITYTISFSNTGTVSPGQITIFDQIPPNTTLVPGKTSGDFILAGSLLAWQLSSPENTSPLTFTVVPTTTDVIISNQAYATATQVASPGEGAAPTADNCNGFYSLNNPIGNFGDPDCYFANNNAQAKSELYELLRAQDPTNADGWFLKVIPCESSYNPNAYLAASASGLGAYGLYQMNPDGQGNNEYDSGSVPWRTQTSNAVTYGKMLTANGQPLGAYWHCWQ